MQPESRLKLRVVDDLKSAFGADLWIVKVQQRAIRGIPDLICCIRGLFVALELKRHEDCDLQPLQLHNVLSIKKAGGIAYRVTPQNWSDTLTELQRVC